MHLGCPSNLLRVWIHEGHAHQTENQTWSNQDAFSNVTSEENGIATIVTGETWGLGPWHFSCFIALTARASFGTNWPEALIPLLKANEHEESISQPLRQGVYAPSGHQRVVETAKLWFHPSSRKDPQSGPRPSFFSGLS